LALGWNNPEKRLRIRIEYCSDIIGHGAALDLHRLRRALERFAPERLRSSAWPPG
jgi:hypothetical protein